MNLEVKILKNNTYVKQFLSEVSSSYQEDFLLDDIVFITVDNVSVLKPVEEDIQYKDEPYAFQI